MVCECWWYADVENIKTPLLHEKNEAMKEHKILYSTPLTVTILFSSVELRFRFFLSFFFVYVSCYCIRFDLAGNQNTRKKNNVFARMRTNVKLIFLHQNHSEIKTKKKRNFFSLPCNENWSHFQSFFFRSNTNNNGKKWILFL